MPKIWATKCQYPGQIPTHTSSCDLQTQFLFARLRSWPQNVDILDRCPNAPVHAVCKHVFFWHAEELGNGHYVFSKPPADHVHGHPSFLQRLDQVHDALQERLIRSRVCHTVRWDAQCSLQRLIRFTMPCRKG